LADPEYSNLEPQRLGGYRTHLGVPLLRDGSPIGVILVSQRTVRPFDSKQIELVTTFADQAVIAIENTRLFEAEQQRTKDLSESLQQQTATADVLKVISQSAFDLQAVFDTLTESAARLCDADDAWLFRREGESYRWAASYGMLKEKHERIKSHMVRRQISPGRGTLIGRTALEGQPVQIADVLADSEYVGNENAQRIGDYRTVLGVPLLRDGVPIGAIALMRTDVRPFTNKQIELAGTFADQAVIAIENVRLFDEVQARTHELSEALEQQTATSEVLRVISSSPGELNPVFEAMLANATRLCEANFGSLYLREGDAFRITAMHNAPPAYEELRRSEPVIDSAHPAVQVLLGRLAKTREIVHITDLMAAPLTIRGALAKFAGARTVLAAPMVKEAELIGAIIIYRQEVRPFTDKQIELVTSFALSLPSRTRACSTSCANRFCSRPPPPTCLKSSAAQPSICGPCLIPPTSRSSCSRPSRTRRSSRLRTCGCSTKFRTRTGNSRRRARTSRSSSRA
jgi:GAF domain-containing protein